MVEEKREKTKQREQQQTLSEKKEEARTVSEQRDKGWIHVIRVHDTTHLAVTTTAGQQTLTRLLPLLLASELHSWRFELEIFPSRLPCGHVFEPKLDV